MAWLIEGPADAASSPKEFNSENPGHDEDESQAGKHHQTAPAE